MEEKTQGIVIAGTNFGENDKILNIFTPDKGVISAKIKGVKKAGAKLKFASEPFCFSEYVFSNTNGRRIVTGASLIDSFYPIREDLNKLYCASVIAEFERKFLKEDIINAQVFILTIETLKNIAYADNPTYHLAKFLVKGLSLAGFWLKAGKCLECGKDVDNKPFFDYEIGGFYCEDCATGNHREINSKTYLALRSVLLDKEINFEQSKLLLRLLDFYIRIKTEENIKSLKELILMLN